MRHTTNGYWRTAAAAVLVLTGLHGYARARDTISNVAISGDLAAGWDAESTAQPATQAPAQPAYKPAPPPAGQPATTTVVPAQPANQPANPAATAGQPIAGTDKPPLKQEELDQLLAPIALYPDSLVSQILMASTYPIEVVEADRWIIKSKDLKGDALAKALEAQTWDASVKSLVNFPQVLSMMSEKLDMTVKLGDAFLDQQEQVMQTIQKLRGKAQETGNLKTTPEQTVKVEQQGSTQTIVIEPANPQVIYVPTYNPTVVYGTWPYPAYPPYYYYPPSYTAGSVALSFGIGVACGAAWGYAWGHCNWGGGDVDIDVNRNTNFNRNIDRSKYQGNRGQGGQGGKWQHNPAHRQGVAYRDSATTQKYGGQRSTQAVQSREAYRGRADAGRSNLSRDTANTPGRTAGNGAANRPSQTPANRSAGAGSQPSRSSSGSSSAFDGANRGGQAARQSGSRGSASRSSSGGSRGGGGRGGGGRGGGGRR